MSDQQTRPSTPWHLWLVGGLLLAFNALGVVDYIATVLWYEPYLSSLPEDVLAYYANVPTWMYVIWGGSIFGGFLGALLLLLRRKIALPVSAVAWVCSLGAAIFTYRNPVPGTGGDMTFYVIVLGVAFLVLVYLYWLARRKILR